MKKLEILYKENDEREYRYKVQKIDIKTIVERNISSIKEFKTIYNQITDNSLMDFVELKSLEANDFIHGFNNVIDYIDYVSMNAFDLETMIRLLEQQLQNMKETLKEFEVSSLKYDEDYEAYKTLIILENNKIKSLKHLQKQLSGKPKNRK